MTKTIDIVEGNKSIEDFVGKDWIREKFFYGQMDEEWELFDAEDWEFHSSFDWLMPVVKKIHELNTVGIAMHYEIEKQWNVVVSFIQWYKTQTQTK